MAYTQWVTIKISPAKVKVTIKNVVHEWGKFYSGSKDNEVDPKAIDGTEIDAGDSFTVSACGREDAASGTTGSFDLYDGSVHIGNYSWDCPWGKKTNESTWSPSEDDNYIVQITGANLGAGALGNILMKVVKI